MPRKTFIDNIPSTFISTFLFLSALYAFCSPACRCGTSGTGCRCSATTR
jgi:hypothetical protein